MIIMKKVFKYLSVLCLSSACLVGVYYWRAPRYGCSGGLCRRSEHRKLAEVPQVSTAVPLPMANNSPTVTVAATEWINPGCKEKVLSKYRSVYTGKVYDHPSIVHYAKLRWDEQRVGINFREYTSALSVYKFLHPERIIFHTNSDIVGNYWDKISSWENVQIELNKMPPVRTIGGENVLYIQHVADYVKLRALYEYGGIILDFDVIIVNGTRLKQEQRISECILSEEGQYVNGGFHSCIKHSPFIAKWLEGYDTDYKPRLWLHNVSFKPAGLLLDPNSTVCYNLYLDDTISINPHWGIQREWLGNKVQWRTKTAAHYFVKTGIAGDNEHILEENHSLAQLIRHVHEA